MRWIFAFWIWIGTAAADPVVVFAAVSLKEPLDQLTQGTDVVVSYAGSGTLASQVMQGAPADVVLLANVDWMDALASQVEVRDVADFASNALVLIGGSDGPKVALNLSLVDRLTEGPLAMGFTKAVPAGIYGRAALTSLGLWKALDGKIAEVDNVRSVLTLVARGEAPLGITYATDARVSEDVKILAVFAPETHPEIRYVGGALTARGDVFWALVRDATGQSTLADAGFLGPIQ